MLENPLGEKIENDEPALGTIVNSPGMVELCAHMGFDWYMVDQMFTSNDWYQTKHLIRAGEATGITPVVRVQSNPWIGYDHRIAVDVSRAVGLGAHYVMVSNSNKKEIDESVETARHWHRDELNIHPFSSFEEWNTHIDEMADATHVIPQPESVGALDQIEEIMTNPNVDLFFFAMTDASRVLADSDEPDWENPELWDLVDRAVKLGKETGTVIGANTSYAYSMDIMADRAVKLADHGVRMILLQAAPFLYQVAVGEFLDGIKGRL